MRMAWELLDCSVSAQFGAMTTAIEEYNPPWDAGETFQRQLRATMEVARQVKEKTLELQRAVQGAEKHSEVQAHLEYLSAQRASFRALTTFARTLSTSLQEKEEDADEREMMRINETYSKMTVLMKSLEDQYWHVLGMPSSWFLRKKMECVSWVQENPKLSASLLGALGGVGATALALQNHWSGYCIIFRLVHGCSCASWGVLGSVAIGAAAGLVIGGLFLGIFHVSCSLTAWAR